MKKLLALIALLLFAGCNPNWVIKKPTTLDEISKKKIVIAPVVDPIDIRYDGDVEDEFGKGDKDQLILSYIRKQLAVDLQGKSVFGTVLTAKYQKEPVFLDADLAVDKSDPLRYRTPAANSSVEFEGCDADIILFINHLDVNTETSLHTIQGIPAGMDKSLKISFNFLYWDNRSHEIISFGKTDGSSTSSFAPVIKIENWNEAIDGTMSDLLCGEAYSKP